MSRAIIIRYAVPLFLEQLGGAGYARTAPTPPAVVVSFIVIQSGNSSCMYYANFCPKSFSFKTESHCGSDEDQMFIGQIEGV